MFGIDSYELYLDWYRSESSFTSKALLHICILTYSIYICILYWIWIYIYPYLQYIEVPYIGYRYICTNLQYKDNTCIAYTGICALTYSILMYPAMNTRIYLLTYSILIHPVLDTGIYMYSNLQYIDVSSIGYRLMSPCINQEKLSQLTSSPEQYVYKI